MSIRVVIADDHAVVRDGLRLLLDSQPDIEVVGEACDGREAVQQVAALRPDVVVMDLAMPGLNGIEATRRVVAEFPETQVVALSMYSTAQHMFHALDAGALGYLRKESAGAEVAKAIRAVMAGQRYLSQKAMDTLVEEGLRQRRSTAAVSPLERLSPREREILQLVVEGKPSSEIGEALQLSPKTVDTYRSRLMSKLGVDDLPGLVKFAIMHGLTPLE